MKSTRCHSYFAAAFAFSALFSPIVWCDASNVLVEATLSTNTIHVGDRVLLTVKAQHDAGTRVVVPSINNEPFVAAYDVQSEQKTIKEGRISTIHRVAFSSFVIGEHRVSTNNIIVLGADGKESAFAFPDLLINVISVLSNPPPELSDIKPAVSIPGRPWLRVVWMILLVLIIGLLAALLLRVWMKRPAAPATMRTIPPHEIALSALNALWQRGFIEKGEAQPFYVELSAIVRLYLEERFDLRAPEQTTEEFIRSSSRSSSLSLEHRQLTQNFLEQSDLVKFAKFEPGPDVMKSAWESAARLVRETIPAPIKTTGGVS